MLRGENIVCGTTTTGTGTLTLAATPASVGAIDPHAWLTSKGYVSGGIHLIPYCITEYADSTFAKPIQQEYGVGTYTLGASISADTLARTTIQETGVQSGPTYSDNGVSAITIGTAANALVYLGARAADFIQCNPYFDGNFDNLGLVPDNVGGTGVAYVLPASGSESFIPFRISKPIVVKRGSIYVNSGSGGGTSTAFFRLYEIGTDGQPGRLLIDLGALGGTNPINAGGAISTALATTGVFLSPGDYIVSLLTTYSQGAPNLIASATYFTPGGVFGTKFGVLNVGATATSGNSVAPDPANKTGYTIVNATTPPTFWLKST